MNEVRQLSAVLLVRAQNLTVTKGFLIMTECSQSLDIEITTDEREFQSLLAHEVRTWPPRCSTK